MEPVRAVGKEPSCHGQPQAQPCAEASTAKAVRLLWCDTGGIRRCRVIPGHRYAAAQSSGVGITTACMAMPAFADCPAAGAGLTAVGEARMVPVEASRVALSWCPGHQAALVEFRSPAHDGPWECCPRSALRRTLGLLRDRFGLRLKVGFEIEFLLLARAPPAQLAPGGQPGAAGSQLDAAGIPGTGLGGSGWRPVDGALYCQSSALDRQAAVLDAMVGALEAMGVGVLQWHAESAPGQFEVALQYGEALAAADQLLLAKEALVGVAARHGLSVSFLPKPIPGAAGSGCHAHMSLWKDSERHMTEPRGHAAATTTAAAERATNTAAADTDATAPSVPPASAPRPTAPHPAPSPGPSPSIPPRPSPLPSASSPPPTLLSFLAGLLFRLHLLLPFTAPCPNSFDRLRPGAWAGAHAAWGHDNREAPLRLTAPGPGRLAEAHLEYKALDGAANPYVALAAIVVAGMEGLASGSLPPEPCQVPPGELDPEEAARLGVRPLPGSLEEALQGLQGAEDFRAALTEAIGAPLLQAFMAVRRAEAAHGDLDTPAELLLRYT